MKIKILGFLLVVFSGIVLSQEKLPPPPMTTLDNYVDYNRAYMSKGDIDCKDTTIENADVIMDMENHKITWSAHGVTREYQMTILDVFEAKGSRLSVNIVGELIPVKGDRYQSGKIQIISSKAHDSTDKTLLRWKAQARVNLSEADGRGFMDFSSTLKCKVVE